MKRLLLLRHAKSDWSDPALPDELRPLNRRGERARHRMAAHSRLRRAGRQLHRDVACDPSGDHRCRRRRGARGAGGARSAAVHFGAAGILAVVRSLPDVHDTVLLAGHNPGFEDLSTDLTGEVHDYLTASLGVIDLPVDQWRSVRTDGSATLERLVHPRDLPG
ncbi:MAG: hypothetical protein R2699_17515 [Acidimicrobiales bacterium]